MSTDTILIIEGEEVTLDAFIEANTDDGMLQISSDELKAILNLVPGESTHISVHAGWMEIKRKGGQATPPNPDVFKRKYETIGEIDAVISQATELKHIANLYYINAGLIEGHPDTKQALHAKKNELLGVDRKSIAA